MANAAASKAVETALVKFETASGQVALSPEIVRKYLVNGNGAVSDQEVMMFLNLCKYQGLNPFLREAYLIKYDSGSPATIVTGKETFTKRADRNEKYDGFDAGVVLLKDGVLEYREGSLVTKTDTLVGGWANVYRKDRARPFRMTVSLDEYMPLKKDGTPQAMWKKMPGSQIRKVALVGALREAFPEEFGGMYSPEEMRVDDTTLDTEPIQQPNPPDSDQLKDKSDQKDMKATFAAIDTFCNQHTNYDREIFTNLAKGVLYESYKVQSCSELSAAQWKGIYKNINKLIERAETKYVEEMFAGGDPQGDGNPPPEE